MPTAVAQHQVSVQEFLSPQKDINSKGVSQPSSLLTYTSPVCERCWPIAPELCPQPLAPGHACAVRRFPRTDLRLAVTSGPGLRPRYSEAIKTPLHQRGRRAPWKSGARDVGVCWPRPFLCSRALWFSVGLFFFLFFLFLLLIVIHGFSQRAGKMHVSLLRYTDHHLFVLR